MRKGYLKSTVGGATHERGGRSKRLFEITKEGDAALQKAAAVAARIIAHLKLKR